MYENEDDTYIGLYAWNSSDDFIQIRYYYSRSNAEDGYDELMEELREMEEDGEDISDYVYGIDGNIVWAGTRVHIKHLPQVAAQAPALPQAPMAVQMVTAVQHQVQARHL